MILTTTDSIKGKNVTELGLVMGNTVQSVHAGKDILAGFKNLVGGELTAYNEMLTNARQTATQRMFLQAQQMGADAIVGIRYTSNSITQGAAEILAYGTAIKFI
ncbi:MULTISPECIES: YbjQ family protein [unclassified Ruminococcus]|uniref:YbjQ family protein n=1 Tax=unclassified Ruminococcus TaxID=2608920 RepID=UPI002109AC38|nr:MULTISPECIES: YbjQ family protein [unclassified Ruminococcus]MCQ4022909.1 heavy metal-binding domain-containing protein [Ruminococcus sp. zg-924]MCQ4115275.1 heavy metal-binding domain-containing protein [Ruminococcus sp. zg-921]